MCVQVSPPKVIRNGPLQLLITNLDYDEHKGRIAIGRVTSGSISRAESVLIGIPGVVLTTFLHPNVRVEFSLPTWVDLDTAF